MLRLAANLLLVVTALACIPVAAASTSCASLSRYKLDASQIGLPTRGAIVRRARPSSAHGTLFCKVLGEITAVDPTAQPIEFEVNLPDQWNGKAVQFGGGSFDGHLETAMGPGVLGDKRQPSPLQRGYSTFGSDSGHHHHYLLLPDIVNAVNAEFALNDEQRRNFASDELKKTHDVALAIILKRYGARAKRMYFLGGSTGGREAMMVIDRWPEDYDGVLAAYAAWNQIESDLQFIGISRALYARGPDGRSGWLSHRDTRLLNDSVLRACDAADGLSDGIVSNPAACVFDPTTLRRSDGKSHRGCFSLGQLHTIAAFSEEFTSTFAVENGITAEPGYSVLRGADLSGSLGIFQHAFHPPIPLLNSFHYVVADGVLRFFLTKDKHFNALTFDPRTGSSPGFPKGHWIEGIRQQSREDDASLADLTPFARHGGKLLLVHGTADTIIPTAASILLYQRIVAAMGKPTADQFLRLYLIPGFGHGMGKFNAAFDALAALDAWADRDVAPAGLVVSDQNGSRTRPLCAYPGWPRYMSGNADSVGSFTCTETH